ncbi:MAG: gamma-glutamyl-gamma-aminobutyrate hydrolase family protein [bacterium]|jgi:putative glutamine amidotransferase
MISLLLSKNVNEIVLNEYLEFANLIKEEYNKKFNKNYEVKHFFYEESKIDDLANSAAIILSGGVDVYPEFYNSTILYDESLYKFDKNRDQFELELLEKYHKSIPIFGICRGIQIINVYFKGTLFQHLPYDIKGIVIDNAHKIYPEIEDFKAKRKLRHLIYGTFFDEIDNLIENVSNINELKLVNSRHHQAIKKLAPDFKILALSKDGIVEMIKHQNLPILAVQYHPEQKEIIDNQLPLVKYFVNSINL